MEHECSPPAHVGKRVDPVEFPCYTAFAPRLKGRGVSGRRRMGASAAKPAIGARLEIGLDIIEMGKDFRALAKGRYDIASEAGCVRW